MLTIKLQTKYLVLQYVSVMIFAFFHCWEQQYWSSQHFGPQQDISISTGQIAMKFAVDVQGPQSMIPILF